MSCYIHTYTFYLFLFGFFLPKMEAQHFEQYSNAFLMGVNKVIVLVLIFLQINDVKLSGRCLETWF